MNGPPTGANSKVPAESPPLGWSAHLTLGFEARQARTVLVHRSQRGPLAVQRPFYPGDGSCHLYILHPPGGVVGGDRLHVEAKLSPGSAALITTPGAGKLYRSAGATAFLEQRLHVAEGAVLEWLPQECIVFPGAVASVSTRIDLQGEARVAAWEIQCLGLPVRGQGFDTGAVDFQLQIWRDDCPVLLERLVLTPEAMHSAPGVRGRPVVGTLAMGPATEQSRDLARDILGDVARGDLCAATLVDGLLVIRYLGASTSEVRRLFGAVWAALRPALFERPPCIPRIWAT